MRLRALLREPLLHFFVLAAGFFLIEQVVSSTRKVSIHVDAETARYLIRQREELELRVLSESERENVIDAYIEDEILYAEAYRRGLDRGDSRMRRNLILKMRGLLIGDPGEPTEDELRSYFDANPKRFTQPATISLDQVYFEDRQSVPEGFLEALNEGLDPAGMGVDSYEFGRSLPDLTHRAIAESFGAAVGSRIVAIDDADWHGPFESPRGVHFVRVAERRPAVAASYDAVRPYLQGDWLMERSRQVVEAEVERLKADYRIVVEQGP